MFINKNSTQGCTSGVFDKDTFKAGGTSRPGLYTMKAIIENYRAWKVNGLRYPIRVLLKPFLKIRQFLPISVQSGLKDLRFKI